eukprot:m51a1_g1157 hypothetical protein (281) ;mRNA; r:318508-319350
MDELSRALAELSDAEAALESSRGEWYGWSVLRDELLACAASNSLRLVPDPAPDRARAALAALDSARLLRDFPGLPPPALPAATRGSEPLEADVASRVERRLEALRRVCPAGAPPSARALRAAREACAAEQLRARGAWRAASAACAGAGAALVEALGAAAASEGSGAARVELAAAQARAAGGRVALERARALDSAYASDPRAVYALEEMRRRAEGEREEAREREGEARRRLREYESAGMGFAQVAREHAALRARARALRREIEQLQALSDPSQPEPQLLGQ